MSREKAGFRENLQDILEFSGGHRVLSVKEVKEYTGFRDDRTVKKRFPFKDGYISAVNLAMCLSERGCLGD
jgi:hypothetical protein